MYRVEAPFTPEQVASLNAYQVAGVMHPFTCGADDCHGIRLIAAHDGWHCASGTCDYRQDWSWLWMADWSWRSLALSPLCEIPHATIEEEDACEQNRLAVEFEAHAAESLAIANEA